MKIYTFQLAKWRKVKALNIPYLDISLKSGEWRLAPDIGLRHVYRETGNDELYTDVYNRLLNERYQNEPEYFKALCNKEAIAFACYCRKDKFCHRHLLVKFLEGITDVEYCGEID